MKADDQEKKEQIMFAVILVGIIALILAVTGGEGPPGSFTAMNGIVTTMLAIVYFVPTVVGWHKDAPRIQAIFALNLLTGWTFVGWVAALIWAMVDGKKEVPPRKD